MNKVAVLRPGTLLTKKLWQSYLPVCFTIYLGNIFYRTPLVTASVGSCSSTHKCEVWKGIFLSIDHWIVPNVSSKIFRSSRPDVFLRKGVLKICIKFTGEHPCRSANSIKLQSNYPCRSAISIKLLCNFIEIGLWHMCSSVNLLHIFRTPFPRCTEYFDLLSSNSKFSNSWF